MRVAIYDKNEVGWVYDTAEVKIETPTTTLSVTENEDGTLWVKSQMGSLLIRPVAGNVVTIGRTRRRGEE
jgi:hypothetical protein